MKLKVKKKSVFVFMFPILVVLSESGVYNYNAAGEGLISKCESIVTGH